MKLKNFFELLGVRARPRRYGYKVTDLNEAGKHVRYALWQHPAAAKSEVSIKDVRTYAEFIKEGDFCIDIGAHAGDSTLPIALNTGKTGLTLALEPNPYVYHVLEKNVRTNRELCRIDTMMAAAAPKEGFLQFEYSDPGFCNGGRHENISAFKHGHAFKLDVFSVNLVAELESDYAAWLPRLKFIKVDAEGFDLYVLKSIESVIRKYNPIIKAEVYKKLDLASRRELLAFMEGMGYSVWHVDSEPMIAGERLSVDNLMNWDHCDIVCWPSGQMPEGSLKAG